MVTIIPGVNDLEYLRPDLMADWDWETNNSIGIYPYSISEKSGVRAFWKCRKCGGSWEQTVHARASGKGCPICSGRKIVTGINDLNTLYPNIAKDWDSNKNSMSVSQISPGSHSKAWWICSTCNHSWQAVISSRAYNNRGCPACKNQVTIPGKNDLFTLYPDIAREFDPDNKINAGVDISKINCKSGKILGWKCNLGHSFNSAVYNRTTLKTGCIKCKSGQTSYGEQFIYYFMKEIYPDTVNRYKAGNKYEFDILIPSLRIAIEYDGAYYHVGNEEMDTFKEKLCQENNVKFIRVKDNGMQDSPYINNNIIAYKPKQTDLNEQLYKICVLILNYIGTYEINNVNIDKIIRLATESVKRNTDYNKSVAYLHSYLLDDYDTDNNIITLADVTPGSDKIFNWKCKTCGYSWKASISNRVNGTGCPHCSRNVVVSGVSDLATLRADLLKQWDYSKNKDIQPTNIRVKSNKAVWWKCNCCGYEWKQPIMIRSSGKGRCPNCKNP